MFGDVIKGRLNDAENGDLDRRADTGQLGREIKPNGNPSVLLLCEIGQRAQQPQLIEHRWAQAVDQLAHIGY
jgi:hypothetical protein